MPRSRPKAPNRQTAQRRRSPIQVVVEDAIGPGDLDAWVRRYVAIVLSLEGMAAPAAVAEPIRKAVP